VYKFKGVHMQNAGNPVIRIAAGLALFLSLLLPAAAREAVPRTIRAGPIAFVAHGALFDGNGNEIDPTPEFIAMAQEFYLRELLRIAPPELARSSEALRATVRERARAADIPDLAARSMSNAAALDLLMNRTTPADFRLFGKLLTLEAHRSLQERTDRGLTLLDLPDIDWPDLVPWRPRLLPRAAQEPRFMPGRPRPRQQTLQQAPEGSADDAASRTIMADTSAQRQAYRDQCAAAGVPIPPDWGTPEWISQGELTSEFISGELEAEVFTWNSSQPDQPEGMCIALPRWDESNQARFLGIICLSKRWSKACFWDNQTGGAQFFPQRGAVYPLSAFGGGADPTHQGAGVCTECHAGQNPYVIHPNTPLGRPKLDGLPLFSNVWYEPIVRAGWPRNPGPLTSDGACSGCHNPGGEAGAFPIISRDLQFGYCTSVLELAISRTMPPLDPGSLANKPHPQALRSMCDDPPPPPVQVALPFEDPPFMMGVEGFGTKSDVFVVRSGEHSEWRLWGTRRYADVTATANAYCLGLGQTRAASWQASDCGEDESSYVRFNPDNGAWEGKRSGSRNNPRGQCLYPLLSQVTCVP
jgi:hypothetical protein